MWKSNVRLLQEDRILYSFSYIQRLFLSSQLFEKHLGFSALKESTARFRHRILNGTSSQCFPHPPCYLKAMQKEYSVCRIDRESPLYRPSYCSLVHRRNMHPSSHPSINDSPPWYRACGGKKHSKEVWSSQDTARGRLNDALYHSRFTAATCPLSQRAPWHPATPGPWRKGLENK